MKHSALCGNQKVGIVGHFRMPAILLLRLNMIEIIKLKKTKRKNNLVVSLEVIR